MRILGNKLKRTQMIMLTEYDEKAWRIVQPECIITCAVQKLDQILCC